MKKPLFFLLLIFVSTVTFSQQWMSDLEVAKRLAMAQNKMLLAIWGNAYNQDYPAYFTSSSGKEIFIRSMFAEPVIDSLLWAHFVPVVLREDIYVEQYKKLKNERSTTYLDKFNDNSLKVLDVNGNILNTHCFDEAINLPQFIAKYSLDISFLKTELQNYKRAPDFYSAFYLASKYMDYAFLVNPLVRNEVVDLASIYLKESEAFLKTEPLEHKDVLKQRIAYIEIQKSLLANQPQKVLRKLNRMQSEEIAKVNRYLHSFLYFSSYLMLQDEKNAALWRRELSGLDIKKLMHLINSLK